MAKQQTLFDLEEDWKAEWNGMPEYHQEDLTAVSSVNVHFETIEDMQKFSEVIGHSITTQTRGIYYPIKKKISKVYVADVHMNPRYPIYIISKGRWESR